MLAGLPDQTQFQADADIARYIADMLSELKTITDAAGCANISALLRLAHREALVSERLSSDKVQFMSELLMELRDLAENRGGAQLASLLDAACREAHEYAQALADVADEGLRPPIKKAP